MCIDKKAVDWISQQSSASRYLIVVANSVIKGSIIDSLIACIPLHKCKVLTLNECEKSGSNGLINCDDLVISLLFDAAPEELKVVNELISTSGARHLAITDESVSPLFLLGEQILLTEI